MTMYRFVAVVSACIASWTTGTFTGLMILLCYRVIESPIPVWVLTVPLGMVVGYSWALRNRWVNRYGEALRGGY